MPGNWFQYNSVRSSSFKLATISTHFKIVFNLIYFIYYLYLYFDNSYVQPYR